MKGIVVAPQPAAVETGVEVLEAGGNAFDAAIAAGFMQMVTDPFMCGLGGWGAATVYRADTGAFEHIGFWPRIGSRMRPDIWVDDVEGYTDIWRFALFSDRRNMIGYRSIMTPGTVAGFDELHRRHASLPLVDLLGPSIEASREGFPIPEYVASRGHQPSLPGMPDPWEKYASTPAARALFHGPDGRLKRTGDPYSNPDQARTLERLASVGARDFYEGGLAEVIVADFEANDAFVTREDLAGYRPVVERPLIVDYRGYEVASSAAPGGGILMLQVLNILEQFDLPAMDHGSPEHLHGGGGVGLGRRDPGQPPHRSRLPPGPDRRAALEGARRRARRADPTAPTTGPESTQPARVHDPSLGDGLDRQLRVDHPHPHDLLRGGGPRNRLHLERRREPHGPGPGAAQLL